MLISKITVISISPSIPEEYLWWIEHRKEMIDEGYVLYEQSTSTFQAKLEKMQGFDLRGKENDP